jgi:RhtB (resistance to homoserine/threonine) family protein
MSAFLTVALVHLLAVMSPGPDFILTTKNSLVYSRRIGVFTAAGLACGILVHSAYCIMGIGVLISRSILLFNVLKYAGAAYLLFIGWKALTAKSGLSVTENDMQGISGELRPAAALRMGFLCNVLNPKATLFILALFTQVVAPGTSLGVEIFYGVYMACATFLWFTVVASLLSLKSIHHRFERMQGGIEKVMGLVLIALGIRIALSARE